MENVVEDLRIAVLNGAKAIFHKGLADMGEGNVSIRIPGKDEFFITPTFNRYDIMTEKDVVYLKFDGTQLSKGKSPSAEYQLHVDLYKARPRANCVIHTHSPYATMLSVAGKKIPVLLEEMIVFLGGEVNVSEFGHANTDELGVNAIKALNRSNGILLANHGVLVCGRTMVHAVKTAELVEKMAKVYWGACQIGTPSSIPEDAYPPFMEKFESQFSTY